MVYTSYNNQWYNKSKKIRIVNKPPDQTYKDGGSCWDAHGDSIETAHKLAEHDDRCQYRLAVELTQKSGYLEHSQLYKHVHRPCRVQNIKLRLDFGSAQVLVIRNSWPKRTKVWWSNSNFWLHFAWVDTKTDGIFKISPDKPSLKDSPQLRQTAAEYPHQANSFLLNQQ